MSRDKHRSNESEPAAEQTNKKALGTNGMRSGMRSPSRLPVYFEGRLSAADTLPYFPPFVPGTVHSPGLPHLVPA